MQNNHALFIQYPLNGTATISTGVVPTPYHIYDGYGAFIGGTVDLAPTRQLLGAESVVPVVTDDGRTPMGIWVCNFTQASLGPHHELQFSFFTSEEPRVPISSHPLSLVGLMTRPSVRMLCHGLWNNSPQVVAYNRELLSLNSRRLTTSHIAMDQGALQFQFNDGTHPLLSGNLPALTRPSLRASWDLTRQLGFRKSLSLATQPWIGLRILNPTGVLLDRNAVAESFTKNAVNLLRYFDQRDTLQIAHASYRALNFRPQFVQYMKGFKFVYLQPK